MADGRWYVPLGLGLGLGAALAAALLAVVPAPRQDVLGDVRSPGGSGLARVPVGLQAAVSSAVGAGRRQFRVRPGQGGLVGRGGGLSTVFGASGPTVQGPGGRLSLRLVGVGRPGALALPAPVAPAAGGTRVSYRRGGLSEWYRNGPLGLEQGFTLARRPPGRGELTVAVRASGTLAPRLSGSRVVFARGGGPPLLSYGALSALDATGRAIPARLELAGRVLRLRVTDARARYPLTIDPFVQQGVRLTGAGEVGQGWFGSSVALSADGNTALVGGFRDNTNQAGPRGAAWVFVRSGSSWSQQGPKLTGKQQSPDCAFGVSVALSDDGNTALIGGSRDDGLKGAAWVFTRSGSTWSQLGDKLTAEDEAGGGFFGNKVALSGNGAVALIGGFRDNKGKGAAWVFRRFGSIWVQQGSALIPGRPLRPVVKGARSGARARSAAAGDIGFGSGVALSGDGDIALIGGFLDDKGKGAAWTFTRAGSRWRQLGGKLTGIGEAGDGEFGSDVALSSDGDTALVGGRRDNNLVGAAWAFRRRTIRLPFQAPWVRLGGKLTPGAGNVGKALFGENVALSHDGSIALIGARGDDSYNGAAWVFARSGAGFSQQGPKVTGDGGEFAYGVALSADANTAVFGAISALLQAGTVSVFVNPPAVTTLTPASGGTGGGTPVTITGSGFHGASAVRFGTTPAASFKVASDTQINAVAPPGAPGTVDVTVTTSGGTSAITAGDRYTYQAPAVTSLNPASGPTGGGTTVTITGSNFTGAGAVRFGQTNATSFKVVSATQITAVAPPGAPGTVDVTVTAGPATAATSAGDKFTYVPGPPVPDTTPPALTLTAPRSERVKPRSVYVLATIDEAATETARGTVSVPRLAKVYRLRSATRRVGPNTTTKLTLGIPLRALKAIRKALGRHRRLTARITVTAKDGAGNVSTQKRAIRLRR